MTSKHVTWNSFIQGNASRHQQPIPGTNIPPSHLPAGESSHPMLHFFIPAECGNDADKPMDKEVYLQQLASGHGYWNSDHLHAAGTRSDDFGFRLSVDGWLFAVRGVDVWTLEPDVYSNYRENVSGWALVPYQIGDRGLDAFKLMFNTDVILPSVSSIDLVSEVLHSEVGPNASPSDPWLMDPCSAARSRIADGDFVRSKTGFGHVDKRGFLVNSETVGGGRVFQFCTVALFCDPRTKLWEFNIYCFSILIEDWPLKKKFNERIGRSKPRRPLFNSIPAGQQSHLALFFENSGHKIEIHQLMHSGSKEEFGCSFILDGVRREVLNVDTWILESGFDGEGGDELMWNHYFVGKSGADAYKLFFNTEVMDPGNEPYVMDAVLSGVPKLNADSRLRKFWVTVNIVKNNTGFRVSRGGREAGTFRFVTCSAYPLGDGGEWEFMMFQFEIYYGPEEY